MINKKCKYAKEEYARDCPYWLKADRCAWNDGDCPRYEQVIKICPLVKGECIGIKCMGCKEHTKVDWNGLICHEEKYYTCAVFNEKLHIKENKDNGNN